jgi:cell division protease FtsH
MEKKKFPFWYVGIIVLLMVLAQGLFVFSNTETVTYSEFKALLKAGQVNDLVLTDQEIVGTLGNEGLEGILGADKVANMRRSGTAGRRFITVRIQDPLLVQDLDAAKVRYTGQAESKWLANILSWVLPALVFVAIWGFVLKRFSNMGGVFDIGKSKAKVYMQKQTGVSFDDVAGIDEAKDELMAVVDFLKAPERYRRLGGRIPKGVLIVGAPGTGKTLLAKAVAGEAGVPFFSISGSEFVEMFVGVGAARVRDLFSQAEQLAPCIIFIDELDALGKARGFASFGGHDEREQTLNQLLVEMDGFDTNKGVIIMAATNRPEILDPALLRPGRFDRHIALDRPDIKGRQQILRVHARKVTLAPDVNLDAVAARTPGFAGADLANLVNEAALLAAREGKARIGMSDFDRALDRIVGGIEKKNRLINRKEKETVAYHEAGHALVAEYRSHADRVSKISIIPRGVAALGYTQQTPTEDRYLLKKSELLDRLDVLLGGRVAEELVFGDVSTGAQNDLQRATDMARQMVTQYGMSEQLGLAAYEQLPSSPFLDDKAMQPRETRSYSERTAQKIDDEIVALLDQAHARVKATLTAKRSLLESLAQRLLETEIVDRETLDELFKRKQGEAAAQLSLPQDA